MTVNPYEQADFAAAYVAAEIDAERNRYEWKVTWPALRKFIQPGMRVVDYGCGGGVFTAAMAEIVGPDGSCVGTDASAEMLRHAEAYAGRPNLSFVQWDACQTEPPFRDGTADLLIDKLSLNYVSPEDLRRVLWRQRSCLKATGLLVGVLPDPYKEADYDQTAYYNMERVPIQVGDFGEHLTATAYHHSVDSVIEASYDVGFPFVRALTLPRVRFDSAREASFVRPQSSSVPVEYGVDQSSKRIMYVLGAGIMSGNAYLDAIERHHDWLRRDFPASS